MSKASVLIWVGYLSLVSSWAMAGEIEEAKLLLSTMRTKMDFVRRTGLHQQDEGRILILDKSAANVLKAIDENGMMSLVTFNLYKHMVVKFRYSSQFFEFIRTTRTESAIRELLETVATIRKKLQLDEDPYSTILKSNLLQLLEVMEGLRRILEDEDPLRQQIEALRPDLGEAIAIADLGDRPKAFAAATKVYFRVKPMYPSLQGLSAKPAYALALEIMGLNEFIAEYAQIDKP